MKSGEVKSNKTLLFLFQLLILSLGFSTFYIYIGYAIKPYMFVMALIILYLMRIGELKFSNLFNFEKLIFIFFAVASLTVLQLRYTVLVLRYILAFVFICILYLTVRKTCSLLKKEEIDKAISRGGLIISFSSMVYYVMGLFAFNFNFHYNDVKRFGILCDRGIPRLTTLFNSDPNISVFVIALFFFYYLCNYNRKGSKFGLLLTGAMIILTFSRGAYVGIILPIVFLIFKDKNKSFTKKLFMIFIIFLALFCFNAIMTKYFNISISDTISSRFTGISQDNGSGRKIFWKNAFETFLSHPLFGIGINSTIPYSELTYGTHNYVHNVYLEVLSETGIVGFLPFILFIFSSLKKYTSTYKIDRDSLYLYVTFLSYITQMIFVSVLLTEMMYITLAVSTKYFMDARMKEVN